MIDPHIRGSDGMLKKNTILEKEDTVIFCDVGVHWEGRENLGEYYHHKVAAYSTTPFIEKFQEKFAGKKIFELPLTTGARGAWCNHNRIIAKKKTRINIS